MSSKYIINYTICKVNKNLNNFHLLIAQSCNVKTLTIVQVSHDIAIHLGPVGRNSEVVAQFSDGLNLHQVSGDFSFRSSPSCKILSHTNKHNTHTSAHTNTHTSHMVCTKGKSQPKMLLKVAQCACKNKNKKKQQLV